MPLHEADVLFTRLDAAYPAEAGYGKTTFRIDCIFQGEPNSYEERQDFGDRDDSLIEHIQSHYQFYVQGEDWEKHVIAITGIEGWEQDKAHRDMLLDELTPYMKLHCSLAQMEQTAQGRLQSRETLMPEGAAYSGVLLFYMQGCRPILNQGQYQLPEPPRLANFDQSLQDCKAQVQVEIAWEAAAAGMTMEEYTVIGYEAFQQDTFSIHQLRGEEETRDYRFESYEHLQTVGLAADGANYDLVYTAPPDKSTSLEDTYRMFNIDHPVDFRGHSLPVSDVVVLHRNGQDTAHYVDSLSYVKVPESLRESPLRTAELSTEQNKNMISGITNDTSPEPQPEEPEQLSFEGVVVASGQIQEKPPEAAPLQATVCYCPTNEGAARRAKEAVSFSDYRPGSVTAEYRYYVDRAMGIAERQKKRMEPEYHEEIGSLLDTHARELAENMNKGYEITAHVPSVPIAGPSNFPVRAEEKQNAVNDRNMKEFQYI